MENQIESKASQSVVESYFCVRRHIVCNSSMLYAYKLRVSKTLFFMYLSAKKMTILGWINNNNATAATKIEKLANISKYHFSQRLQRPKKIERRFFVCRQIQR